MSLGSDTSILVDKGLLVMFFGHRLAGAGSVLLTEKSVWGGKTLIGEEFKQDKSIRKYINLSMIEENGCGEAG